MYTQRRVLSPRFEDTVVFCGWGGAFKYCPDSRHSLPVTCVLLRLRSEEREGWHVNRREEYHHSFLRFKAAGALNIARRSVSSSCDCDLCATVTEIRKREREGKMACES